jgi:cytoskeletal protein CcmA (bactofilin family)
MRRLSEPPPSDDAQARSMHIDGAVKGSLSGSKIVLGTNADVDGDITATAVTIHGHFRGQIEAQAVHLRSACHVEGTIRHRSLTVELGARFDGESHPLPDGHAPQPASQTIAAPAQTALVPA